MEPMQKTQRYSGDAAALAEALEQEARAGWRVVSAEYEGNDFVVRFERAED